MRSSSRRISRALRKHGFGDTVAKLVPFYDAIAAFLTIARMETKESAKDEHEEACGGTTASLGCSSVLRENYRA